MVCAILGSCECEGIECEGNARWEGCVGFRVEDVVGHVDQVGPRRIDFGDDLECLVDGEMSWVRSIAQGIEDEGLGGLELDKRAVGDVGDIGAIGEGEEV